MGFGAILALIGIVLFARRGTEGTNSIKMLGFEFQLSGSALVIFVIGALIFLAPIIYQDRFKGSREETLQQKKTPGDIQSKQKATQNTSDIEISKPNNESTYQSPENSLQSEKKVTPLASGQQSSQKSQLTIDIRDLIATQLKTRPEYIDVNSNLMNQPIQYDQLFLLELIMDIEKKWAVTIKDEEIDIENISVKSLADIVYTKLN
jgi:acyl carrier protein